MALVSLYPRNTPPIITCTVSENWYSEAINNKVPAMAITSTSFTKMAAMCSRKITVKNAVTIATDNPTAKAEYDTNFAPCGDFSPKRCPTKMVVAMPIDIGNMKTNELVFKAIWWLATTSAPSGDRNNEVNANNATSQQSAMAIGNPSFSNLLNVRTFGRSIILSKTFKSR